MLAFCSSNSVKCVIWQGPLITGEGLLCSSSYKSVRQGCTFNTAMGSALLAKIGISSLIRVLISMYVMVHPLLFGYAHDGFLAILASAHAVRCRYEYRQGKAPLSRLLSYPVTVQQW